MKNVKANFLLILIMLFAVSRMHGQDVIVFKSGDEIKAKVEEVTEAAIKYRKFDNLGGPLFTISKAEVFMIRYQNGDKEVIKFSDNEQNERRPFPKSSFNLNLLGLIQFGPILQQEIQIGNSLYFTPHLRLGYLGVLSHAVWTEFDDKSKMDPLNFGLGMGLRQLTFSGAKSNAMYFGGFVEYSVGGSTYDIGTNGETDERGSYLTILPNVGYRWRYPSGRFLNLGLYLAYAKVLKFETRLSPSYFTGPWIEKKETDRFYPFLELSFGWEKKK